MLGVVIAERIVPAGFMAAMPKPARVVLLRPESRVLPPLYWLVWLLRGHWYWLVGDVLGTGLAAKQPSVEPGHNLLEPTNGFHSFPSL